MAAVAILDFQFVKFYWQTVSGRPRRIIVINVVKIGISVAEKIAIFRIFKMATVAIFDF